MEFERIGYVLLSVSIFVYWIQHLGSITLNNLFEFLFSTNSKERWNCFLLLFFSIGLLVLLVVASIHMLQLLFG